MEIDLFEFGVEGGHVERAAFGEALYDGGANQFVFVAALFAARGENQQGRGKQAQGTVCHSSSMARRPRCIDSSGTHGSPSTGPEDQWRMRLNRLSVFPQKAARQADEAPAEALRGWEQRERCAGEPGSHRAVVEEVLLLSSWAFLLRVVLRLCFPCK